MVPLAAEEKRQVQHVTCTFLTSIPPSIFPFGWLFPFSLLLESVSQKTESVRQGQPPTTSCPLPEVGASNGHLPRMSIHCGQDGVFTSYFRLGSLRWGGCGSGLQGPSPSVVTALLEPGFPRWMSPREASAATPLEAFQPFP